MTERPILFSAPMVRALLAGTKTQTRRIVKGVPGADALLASEKYPSEFVAWVNGEPHHSIVCPYGVPGDVLWVREEFSGPYRYTGEPPRNWPKHEDIWFWADGEPHAGDWTKPKPSMHMPRWASRISLRITDVRVERLNEISVQDVIAEGAFLMENGFWNTSDGGPSGHDAVTAYRNLWNRINGPGSWAANPWVWAVTFERLP